MSIDEHIEETKRRLGEEGVNFDYLTDELISQDAERDEAKPFGSDDDVQTNTVWYGNNARYGARTVGGVTYQGYWFENDCNGGPDGCSIRCTGFVTVRWHHRYLGRCPNGRERWSFTSP